MYNQLFSFNSSNDNRFEIPKNGLVMAINQESKKLEVKLPGSPTRTFQLEKSDTSDLPALYVTNTDTMKAEVGQVNFGDAALSKTSYALNKNKNVYTFNFRQTKGHLGILDIRDVSGKAVLVTTYYWDLVPIVLEVEGNVLHIKTIEFDEELGLDPWYVKGKPEV